MTDFHVPTRIVIYVVILLVIALYGVWSRRGAARRIKKTLDDSFQAHHIFRSVDAAQFPWLTRTFYDGAQLDIESAGFRMLADIEDETLSATHPDKRTFVRVCVSQDGNIRAAIYEIVVGGPQGKSRQRIQTCELITEMSDDATITTTTAPAGRLLNPPPGVVREHVPSATPLSQMLATHTAQVERYQKEHASATPLPVSSFDDATAAWQKGIDRQRSRLQSDGGITRGELERLAPKNAPHIGSQVYDEMQKLK